MNQTVKKTGIALALAAAGMLGASTALAAGSTAANIHCYGVNTCKGHNDCSMKANSCKGHNDCKTADNACKGQGSCKTAGNSCAGHSSCKGQGFVAMSAESCENIGGTVGK